VHITAVDNVSFFIKPAEIFTLAGESGCGKTTSARIVLGFESPTSGAIIHSGKKEAKNEKVWFTEGIQAIFQDPFSTFNSLRTVDRYFFETVKNSSWQKPRRCSDRPELKLVVLIGVARQISSEFSGTTAAGFHRQGC
jgi:peptide/nickel transport system ATP-binding protein